MDTTDRRNDFSDTIREKWRTRPVRSFTDRKIAGVSGGIGQRYSIDPTIVRIAFVMTVFFGGTGIGLYAAAWLVMRRPSDSASMLEALAGRGRSSDSKGLAIILLIVALGTVPTVLSGSGSAALFGSGMVSLVAMLLGWYALHVRTPDPASVWWHVNAPHAAGGPEFMTTPAPGGDAPAGDAPEGGASGAGATGANVYDGGARPGSRYDSARPLDPMQQPSWDPLGTARFAWDLPEPTEDPAQTKRSRLTSVTLGLAVIATAIMSGLAYFGDIPYLDFTKIAAVPLVVIGAGLVIGSFTRKGYGLLVFTAPLAGLVLLSALLSPAGPNIANIPAQTDRQVTPTEITGDLEFGIGEVDVDLTELQIERDDELNISAAVGETTVTLPENLDVNVTCETGVGSTDCPDGFDAGVDGEGGPVLTLNVETGVGSVVVTR